VSVRARERSLDRVLWHILVLVVTALSGASCALDVAPDLDAHLKRITADHRFSIVRWELQHLLALGAEARSTSIRPGVQDPPQDDRERVVAYTRATAEVEALRRRVDRAAAAGDIDTVTRLQEELDVSRARTRTLGSDAQRILARQIRTVSAENGIRNPLDRWISLPVTFPPVWFELGDPPHALIVSSRERIETVREVLLVPELALQDMEAMEAQVEVLGYSALVVGLGGFGGLYPALVANSSSLPWLVETAVEEWLHQYLAFTPIGFHYVLHLTGVRRCYPVTSMNEALAGIVSEELGYDLLARYYPEHLPSDEPPSPAPEDEVGQAFDFRREMRQTRLRVDELLAEGRIEEAERYMEQRRQFLAANGYYIRKLNQAYFAFHGTYADHPAAVDPIGEYMAALREGSPSLREFLHRAVVLTTREALEQQVGASP